MTVTDTDIAASVRTRWAAVAALEAIVPAASVYRGKVGENTAYPNARLKVIEGDTELTSGSITLTKWRVEIECYVSTQPPIGNTLRAALDAAFQGSDTAPAAGLSVTNATAVLHSMALPGGRTEPTGERQDNKDTLRTTASYEILVQHSRA